MKLDSKLWRNYVCVVELWPFPCVSWSRAPCAQRQCADCIAAVFQPNTPVWEAGWLRRRGCRAEIIKRMYFVSILRKNSLTASWDDSAQCDKVSRRSRLFPERRSECKSRIIRRKKERKKENRVFAVLTGCLRLQRCNQQHPWPRALRAFITLYSLTFPVKCWQNIYSFCTLLSVC